VLWGGDISSPEIQAYLQFCRILLEKSPVLDQFLHDDERALSFLEENAFRDVDLARLLLISSLGGGAESAAILLKYNREAKRPPRTRTSWGVRQITAESDAKAKAQWKEWLSACKKALNAAQVAGEELLTLHAEEERLPKFTPKGSEDEGILSSAFELVVDLDVRVRDLEEYIASIHDALSCIHPEPRRSLNKVSLIFPLLLYTHALPDTKHN